MAKAKKAEVNPDEVSSSESTDAQNVLMWKSKLRQYQRMKLE